MTGTSRRKQISETVSSLLMGAGMALETLACSQLNSLIWLIAPEYFVNFLRDFLIFSVS
jgi:hypothetical protein